MNCLFCKKDLNLLGKNRKALYCDQKCKTKYSLIKDPEARKLKQEIYRQKTSSKAIQLFHAAKTRATKATLDFELTPEWVQAKLDVGRCEVTGLPFSWNSGNKTNPWGPSIDKVDPSKGYTIGNSRLVVWIYNTAKNSFTDADVSLLANAIVQSERVNEESKE